MAVIAAFPLARRTVFARSARLAQAKRVLLGIVAFDILLFVPGHVPKYLNHAASLFAGP